MQERGGNRRLKALRELGLLVCLWTHGPVPLLAVHIGLHFQLVSRLHNLSQSACYSLQVSKLAVTEDTRQTHLHELL